MDGLLVENGDITLRVEVTGTGPTILCAHGWPESPHSWRHQVAHFSQRGFRIAAMDVRGYGSSAPAEVEPYTLRELAGDVAAVAAAAALDDEPVILFGHDWGAPAVWHTAIRHPDRVRVVAGLSRSRRVPRLAVREMPASGTSSKLRDRCVSSRAMRASCDHG
jgi:pimeloyl-ACP methyl ester carboxylesterase